MPANLTPEYLKAEQKFKEATTPEERLEALREMLALIPKHKGTEKMQADIKKRISKVSKEIQQAKGKKKGISYIIKKEGAGQVSLVGLPNSGKSQLLSALTNANPIISEIPISTKKPYPGMMDYENIQIQIIDLPPINSFYRQPWVYEIIKKSNLLLLIIDTSRDDMIEQIDFLIEDLKKSKIIIKRTDEENSLFFKKSIMVANKIDTPSSQDYLPILYEFYDKDFLIIPVSALEKKNINSLKSTIFENLDIIRVYAKPPRREADLSQPFIFAKGSTVSHMAEAIHKDFKEKMKYARVWGKVNYNGQRVSKDYVMNDGDIIEIHI